MLHVRNASGQLDQASLTNCDGFASGASTGSIKHHAKAESYRLGTSVLPRTHSHALDGASRVPHTNHAFGFRNARR